MRRHIIQSGDRKYTLSSLIVVIFSYSFLIHLADNAPGIIRGVCGVLLLYLSFTSLLRFVL